ncbi:MAG: DUF5050 domain-containing protein [Defluviitaleaceae bacterium]|nr:DUF5050 domain-containing protein [Defluviitaleaceae bacterium]
MHTRTKIIIVIVTLIIISGAVTVLLFKPWEEYIATSENEPQQQERRGNTAGNIANIGRVAQDGEWIYFSSLIHESIPGIPVSETTPLGHLRRKRVDGDESELLFLVPPLVPESINVMGDWLYFVTMDGIHRMRIDGSHKEMILGCADTQPYISRIFLAENWLIFTLAADIHSVRESNLYRMSIDGETQERISNINPASITVADGWIYYADRDKNQAVYRIRTDGTERMRLSNSEARGRIIVDDGWVYYSDFTDDISIFKIRIDGTEHQQVVARTSHEWTDAGFNIFDGWIYFSSYLSDGIYRIRTDGTDRQKISDGFGREISIIDDWIYYRPGYDTDIFSPLYRMRKDGTERGQVR